MNYITAHVIFTTYITYLLSPFEYSFPVEEKENEY